VTKDEASQISEVRARADAGATLAAQGISGALDSQAVLEGCLGHFERIRLALKAIGI
jgi:hypothetical protein